VRVGKKPDTFIYKGMALLRGNWEEEKRNRKKIIKLNQILIISTNGLEQS